ncbi:MAG: C1 family peptidase [Bacteroidota bacterium]
MPRILLTLTFSLLLASCVSTQRFSNTQLVETTPLKHQKATGQCWSFASTSLLEAEAIRLGYPIPELSAFFFVYHKYLDQSRYYLENKGDAYIRFGDLTFSVLEEFETYGAVPESVYDGKLSGITRHRQMMNRWAEEDEMNALIVRSLDSLVQVEAPMEEALGYIEGILNDYIGEAPESFDYQGETISSQDFAREHLPLKADEYIELTSYTHHPLYENIMLEIPANWREKSYWNLPINEWMETIDYALDHGFSLAWDGCIRNSGGFRDNGYVKVKGEYEEVPQIEQEQRQSAFERKTTTDDHNMHLVGYTYDRDGQKFYILKNTWGKNRGIQGHWYLSENYFRLRTVSVTLICLGIPRRPNMGGNSVLV